LTSGYWCEDKQHGHGVESWPDGAKYEGNFLVVTAGNYEMGKKHGKGRKEDLICRPLFLERRFHIRRRVFEQQHPRQRNVSHFSVKFSYEWNDGRKYIGDCIYFAVISGKNNKMDGSGEFTWSDGRKYSG
jgi:hypothetical protein